MCIILEIMHFIHLHRPINFSVWRICNRYSVSTSLESSDNSIRDVQVQRESPKFAKLRGPGKPVYSLVKWKNEELLADYVLFEESMQKCKVPWLTYKLMTAEEIVIYLAHYKAVQNKKLSYICPVSKETFETVSQLLYEGRCCGEGCRHCPYHLQNCSEKTKKKLIWNGSYFV